jgi:hypothetical protein
VPSVKFGELVSGEADQAEAGASARLRRFEPRLRRKSRLARIMPRQRRFTYLDGGPGVALFRAAYGSAGLPAQRDDGVAFAGGRHRRIMSPASSPAGSFTTSSPIHVSLSLMIACGGSSRPWSSIPPLLHCRADRHELQQAHIRDGKQDDRHGMSPPRLLMDFA